MTVRGLDDSDIKARVRWLTESGQIWLDDQRMALFHAGAFGSLRQELIESLGFDRAHGILARMGYNAGLRDAEFARRIRPNGTDIERFYVGPQLHNLSGIVNATPIKTDIDVTSGRFYSEFVWEGSFEAEVHLQAFGVHHESACWMLQGYACGFTTGLMGMKILFREEQCRAKGDRHCRIVGRPLEEWEDSDKEYRYFLPDPVADQLVQLQEQVEKLRYSIAHEMTPEDMVGASPQFTGAFDLVSKAAGSEVAVLLMGETGVGKELFARALHKMSARGRGPFIAINCAALPEELLESELFGVERGAFTGAQVSRPGRFERAHGGTLFLDEISELSPPAQAKLLRVLETGEFERIGDTRTRTVDVRLVAATNKDFEKLVRERHFRPDLYFRINVYPVVVPPLRERVSDIPLLVQRFLDKHAARHGKHILGVREDAMAELMVYSWPGNIRELENMIERGVILAAEDSHIERHHLFFTTIRPESHDGDAAASNGLDKTVNEIFARGTRLEELEARLLLSAVERAGGNLSLAARTLGMTRPQLAYRLKRDRDRCGNGEAGKDSNGTVRAAGEARVSI